VPLDSRDPKYSDYLERIRRKIKENWVYPCVKSAGSGECEYKTVQLLVEFGIAKDGHVAFVTVRRQSGWTIYDDSAVNAIKLSAPFPHVPDDLGKTGLPILATFSYAADSWVTDALR
jgi:outer membrane biosynthesis protein TonB